MSRNLPYYPDRAEGDLPSVSASPPPPMEYEGDAGAEGGGFDWRRFIAAVSRYKWLVLAVTVVGTVAGMAATRFVSPVYEAKATMWIETTSRLEDARGPIRSDESLTPDAWVDLLKTGVVLEPVARQMRLNIRAPAAPYSHALDSLTLRDGYTAGLYHLAVSPDGQTFTLARADGAVLQQGHVGEAVGVDEGMEWQPGPSVLAPGVSLDFQLLTARSAAQALANAITTTLSRNGNYLVVSLQGRSPGRITRLVNAVAGQFETVAGDYKRAKLDQLTRILAEQLQAADSSLKGAEDALETFRRRTITLPSEATTAAAAADPVLSGYFQMQAELEGLRTEQAILQGVVTQGVAEGASVVALEGLEAVQKSSELSGALAELTKAQADLRGLRQEYTDEHPLVKRALAQIDSLERSTIPRLANNVLTTIQAREHTLESLVSSTSGELRAIPGRAVEQARLQRQVNVADNLYTNLRQRYEAARLAAVSTIPDVRSVDAAVVPRQPAKDPRPAVVLLASLGSLGLALLGVLFLDRADARFRYPEQVTHGLGLPILGVAPHVHRRNGTLRLDDATAVIEAFRGIRLNLQYAVGSSGPLAITVTSPGIGDGKSFIASNLALAFAEQGYRTLLLDGDVRRGTIHRVIGGSRKPGLTDYLAGRVDRDGIIQHTRYPHLDMIGCGTRSHEAPPLLSSDRMRELLADLRADYSIVLVDTPPLAAGTDPFVFGTLTGNLVLVVRSGSTDRHLTQAKLDLLDRLPVRLVGAILNDVPPTGMYSYYYRAYSYLPDYGVEEEAEAQALSSG